MSTTRLDPWPSRHGKEQARGLAALDTAPEFLLRGEQQMLVEGVGVDCDLDPFAAARDDRQHGRCGVRDPHIVLELRHVFFGCSLFGEMPGQHELGLEHGPAVRDHPVEGRGHPPDHRMLHPALNRTDDLAGLALEPGPVEMLRDDPELDN
jgi:hypothetical protein